MCAHLLLELLPLARGRDEVDDVHEDGVEDRLEIQGRYSEIWEMQGRYRGDVHEDGVEDRLEMWARCGRDVGEM